MWWGRNASDIPASNKSHMVSSVALGKEKKRSLLRKEINYVLYAWHEIKTGHNEVENSWSFMLVPVATESGGAPRPRSQLQPWGEAVALGTVTAATVEGPRPST